MPTSYEKLSALLKELFQLDQADLDFGIYRIMNQKRDEISRFLDAELLPQVKTAFEQYHPADKKVLDEKIEQARKSAIDAGFDPEQSPRVKELRDQQANYSVDTEGLENEVYSHLYSFFRRYYDNGDFISMRRYKEGVYAIPYEGEEVKLHWANADQYYVKTTENFRDYSFRLPSGRFAHFKIVEAETEKDNVKADAEKERRFILATEAPIAVEGDALILRFEYRADTEKRDQKTLCALAAETILAGAPAEWAADLKALAPTESNPKRTLLEKHLSDYTARNTFDYFIHKDLRSFLRRELDFYIKNEVMHLDDIEGDGAPQVEQYLSKIRVIRQIAHKIIEFLAQIEDFQKKLWLKKKFVVETNYCITLDRVPEALYPEICANAAQREEWVRIFAIDEIKKDLVNPGYSIPLTEEFLKSNPFLVVDTKYFTEYFTEKLISNIDLFDQNIEGLIIKSENFQALSFLTKKYAESITSLYTDPPYNTSASEILYKNNYKHSAWLSFLDSRIEYSRRLLAIKGMACYTIDDFEITNLRKILDDNFGNENYLATVPIRNNPSGRSTLNGFSVTHEYGLFYRKSESLSTVGRLPHDDIQKSRYKESDDKGQYEWENLRRNGPDSNKEDRPKQYYPIVIDPTNNCLRILEMVFDENLLSWKLLEETRNSEILLYPDHPDGTKKVWRYSVENLLQEPDRFKFELINGRYEVYRKKYLNDEGLLPRTWWDKPEYSARDNGTRTLVNLFNEIHTFDFPKAVQAVIDCLKVCNANKNSTIIDYFAGSGTTGQAVIEMNREDNGHRQYILIEMGDHFDDVLKPRIQKVIYSKDWKDGKPVSRKGSSHCFKYLRLESYEDALNNLSLQRTHEQQLALEVNPEFKENYMLSYMLDVESKGSLLNIQSFVHPFDYQLNIASGTVGESQPTKVDLVETFNYLIGLHVETLQSIRGFRVVTGKNPAGERTLIIWRDLEEKRNKDLEEFFRKQVYNPRDMEYDLIYVNGDNNLENIRRPDETWKVRLIEEEFVRLMFEEN